MAAPVKNASIQEYFKFKSKITANSVIELLKTLPGSDFTEPHDGQKLFLSAYEERVPPSQSALTLGLVFEYRYRTLTVAAGRRWGKSVMASVLGLAELLVPHSSVMILAPALSNCEVIFKKIHRFLRQLGIKLVTERVRDMELVLENGSVLRVASVENAPSRLGLYLSLLIVDEARNIPRNLIQETILPMLFDMAPLSRAIYISSPAPGFMETMYNFGQSDDPKYASFWSLNSPTYMNPTIPKEELDSWKVTMPPDIYLTEVMGLFTSSEGRVFREFDRVENIFDIEEYPHFSDWLRECLVINSIDPGYNHFFSGIWAVVVEEIDHIFIFAEYNVNNQVTEVHAASIKEIEAEWGVEPALRYGDPASAQTLADLAVTHDLYYMKAIKDTSESINQLNALFFQKSKVTGKRKLLISKDCLELRRQFTEVTWKVGKDDLTKEQSASGVKPFQSDKSGAKSDWDLIDSARYLALSLANSQASGSITTLSFGASQQESEEESFINSMALQGYFKMS